MPSPKTIAIDSSLAIGSVAALHGVAVAERELPEAGQHARLIAAAVDATARSLGWTPGEVELVGVVRGPGSFTGLRVGAATAKAIAWAAGAKLVGVSGFEVIARQTARELGVASDPIHVVYDAGRGELYAAEVLPAPAAAGGWRTGTPRLCSVEEWLAGLPRGAIVSGPAGAIVGERLATRDGLTLAPRTAWLPRAGEAGALAAAHAAAGRTDDPHALVPDYLRPTYAHENGGRSPR
jgi:tRNA threonylcarbamoyladenosine biosynthesis protein TsaB